MLLSRKILFDSFLNAPNCVLDEMLECEGVTTRLDTITRQKKIDLVEKLETKIEKLDFESKECLGLMSRFVEPKFFPFRRSQLKIGYENIMKWENHQGSSVASSQGLHVSTGSSSGFEDLSQVEIGMKTNDNPLALNACMIYKSCLKRKINVGIDETPYQMLFKARLFDSSTVKLRQIVLTSIFCLPKYDLFNLLADILYSRESERVMSHDQIVLSQAESASPSFGYLSIDNLIRSCPPKSDPDAELALIMKYRIVTSGSGVSSLELFNALEQNVAITNPRYLINKNFYSMRCRYVNEFSSFYSKEEVDSILNKEHLNVKAQLSSQPDFVFGIHPKVIDSETLIDLIEVREIESPDECVTFLARDVTESRVLSYEELARYITNTGLINPCTGARLTQMSVKKLRFLKHRDINDAILVCEIKTSEVSKTFGRVEEWENLKPIIDIDVSSETFETEVFDVLNKFYENIESDILETKMVRLDRSVEPVVPIPSDAKLGDFIDNLSKNVEAENACLKNAIKIFSDTIWWNLLLLTKRIPF